MLKKFIKKISAVLIIIFVFTNITTIAIADENNGNNKYYNDALNLLNNIKVLRGYDISHSAEDFVTRSDFAFLLAGILGIADEKYAGTSQYYDVDSANQAYDQINLLTALGIADGTIKDFYSPDQYITYPQILKMLVKALGYKATAESKGGFPIGYFSVATELKLLNRIQMPLPMDQRAQCDSTIIMLYNALFADTLEQMLIGQQIHFSSKKGDNLLSKIFKIYKTTGIVTENDLTHIANSRSNLDKGQIRIDDIVYYCGENNCDNLLGNKVVCYYRADEKNDEKHIMLIIVQNEDDSIVIDSEDNVKFRNNVYYYDNDKGEQQHANISLNANIIYNGKRIAYNSSYLIPQQGNITLIDSDSDGQYDVVKIISYTTFVVNSLADGKVITDKYNLASIDLSEQNYKKILIKDKDGADVKIKSITEWDVLLVAMSLDSEYIEIIISKDKIKGYVEAKRQEDTETVLTINNKEYTLSKSYPQELKSQIKVGDYGAFHLDAKGNIAIIESGSSEYIFGFLIEVDFEKEVSLDKRYSMKLFNSSENGKMLILRLGKYVYVDGEKYKGDEVNEVDDEILIKPSLETDVKKMLENNIGQIIRYKVNNSMEVIAIDTLLKGENEKDESLKLTYTITSGMYRVNQAAFNNKAAISSETKVFCVPIDITKDELYAMKKKEFFGDGGTYSVTSYNTTNNFVFADAILFRTNSGLKGSTIGNNTSMVLVDKVTKANNINGETVDKVYFYQEGVGKSLLSADNVLVNSKEVSAGDIIRYGTNQDGDIDDIEVVYDYETQKNNDGFSNSTNADAAYRISCGYVYNQNSGFLTISQKNPSNQGVEITYEDLENQTTFGTKLMLYDSSLQNNRVKAASLSDIFDYTHYGNQCNKIVIQTKYSVTKSIVIYK